MSERYIDVPYGKLRTFQNWLRLDDSVLSRLEQSKDIFIRRGDDFARFFNDYFMSIPEAKFIIEHQERPGHLQRAWAHWFESLFSTGLSDEFLAYLWKVGVRHVEVNLDQRFSNMGFSLVRQFCQELAFQELDDREAHEVLMLVDRVVDFCLLVETDAYIENTAYCDLDLMKGIADRIRNPVTVIGGTINRLMKRSQASDPLYQTYDFIFSQSTKCERMLRDIKTYLDMFDRSPAFMKISLA
ncbi:MAG: protoglobin domain-containing protein [Nitrospirota bacterium]